MIKRILLTVLGLLLAAAPAAAHRLVWDASTGTVDNYTVESWVKGTPNTVWYHSVAGDVTEVLIYDPDTRTSPLNLWPGVTYQFSVFASNQGGPSGLSNIVDFTVPSYQVPPDSLPPIPPTTPTPPDNLLVEAPF